MSVDTEAEVAAQWWANHLREPIEHDSGDIKANTVANWAQEQDSRNDEFENVGEFERVLTRRLQEKIANREWNYQEPFVETIIVRNDYHADPVLLESAEEAGVEVSPTTTFPIKTTMWLAPGEVRVRPGYGGETRTIWEIGDHLEEIRDHVSEWVWPAKHPRVNTTYKYEPKVFPTDDGYLVRAYGDYDPECYGPETKHFKVLTEHIEDDGLRPTLTVLHAKIKRWRDGRHS